MTACPSDAELAAHLGGDLAAEAAAALGLHLDGCADCRATVIALVRARGTPAGELRPARAAPAIGDAVGRYRLTRVLGAGGMGVVYAARDEALERQVAVKVMRPDLAGDAAALAARMVRESRLLARVTDPAVITVHDVGEADGRVYLAMELIDGGTLAAWLGHAPRSVADIVDVLRRAGRGLAAAHQAGVVHRDFKPDNVLLAPLAAARPARVVVTDFGVARAGDPAGAYGGARGGGRPDGAVELTTTGVAIGTPAYMAPEQLDGGRVDARADVFALGVTLWEALYGARPYAGRTAADLRAAIDRGAGPPPAGGPHGRVPTRVRRAVAAMIAAEPARRPASVGDALAALAPRPRSRALVAVGAIAALAVVAGGARALARRPAAAPDEPCARGAERARGAWGPSIAARLRGAMVAARPDDAAPIDAALAKVATRAAQLVTAHQAACRAQPTPPVLACLAARQLELDAVVAELGTRVDLPGDVADAFAFTIADARLCHAPGASTVEPRWPRDAATRRAVADVRIAAIAAEALRDAARFTDARAAAAALTAPTAAAGWPPLEAELLYLQGGVETIGGDSVAGRAMMQRAAAIAEGVHADYIAASAWSQLVQATTWDGRDPARGLEYAGYADAALTRLGRPPMLEVHVRYSRGTARIAAGDYAAGEDDLRTALRLAETEAPEQVPAIIQGLGLALEERGEYAEAVATYRRALAALAAGPGDPAQEQLFRGRLAMCLAHVGDPAAVGESQAAVALADRVLDARHPDRAIAHLNYAEVLHAAGDDPAALTEIRAAQAMLAATVGERSDLYGNALATEASIVTATDPRAAARLAERACEIQAFNVGDAAVPVAACWSEAAVAMQAAGRSVDAERRLRAALPVLEAAYGGDHALVANAYIGLGEARLTQGDVGDAARYFEEGRARMARSSIDDGYVATAEFGLAQALARREPTRARALAEQAAARWRGDAGWATELAAAEAWLRQHRARAP
ncbi:MAG: serine/threonine protein kinase [Myxococcales bacterium]|nr:serine/threonine protein kinase [Myxococcales bacterium]